MIFKAGDKTNQSFPCDIIRRLPGGTMAELYVARLSCTNHLMFVKGVGKEAPESFQQALKREAEILQKIRMETIPEIYAYLEEPDKRYFIMAYYQGVNLAENNVILSEAHIKQIALSLCGTVSYLHKKEIIYGDLKPSNIIISRKQVILVDYGASVFEKDVPQNICFQGTAGYAAPECFKDNGRKITYLSDIFAFGATLYSLLEQKNPKDHFGRFYLSDEQKKNRWQSVLNKCCALKPEERYQSAVQIYDAIKKIEL